MIIGGLIMAFLLIKINTFKARMYLTLIAVILTVCTYPLMYGFQGSWAVPFFIITGIILQAFPAITFTIAPETARGPAFVGATMGVIALSQSLGIGGVISGAVIESSGYPAMLPVMLLVGAIELVCVIALLLVLRKRSKRAQENS
jgi:predicted MFS family arabinose efflux permease